MTPASAPTSAASDAEPTRPMWRFLARNGSVLLTICRWRLDRRGAMLSG